MTRPANCLSWLSPSVAWTTVMGFLLGQRNKCMTSCSGFKTVLRGWWLDSGWPTARLYTSCRSYSGFTGSLSGSVLSTNSAGLEVSAWDCTVIPHGTSASSHQGPAAAAGVSSPVSNCVRRNVALAAQVFVLLALLLGTLCLPVCQQLIHCWDSRSS